MKVCSGSGTLRVSTLRTLVLHRRTYLERRVDCPKCLRELRPVKRGRGGLWVVPDHEAADLPQLVIPGLWAAVVAIGMAIRGRRGRA